MENHNISSTTSLKRENLTMKALIFWLAVGVIYLIIRIYLEEKMQG